MSYAGEATHSVEHYSREAFLFWLDSWALEWETQNDAKGIGRMVNERLEMMALKYPTDRRYAS